MLATAAVEESAEQGDCDEREDRSLDCARCFSTLRLWCPLGPHSFVSFCILWPHLYPIGCAWLLSCMVDVVLLELVKLVVVLSSVLEPLESGPLSRREVRILGEKRVHQLLVFL